MGSTEYGYQDYSGEELYHKFEELRKNYLNLIRDHIILALTLQLSETTFAIYVPDAPPLNDYTSKLVNDLMENLKENYKVQKSSPASIPGVVVLQISW